MKKLIDTELKYRPTSLNQFVFPNAYVEEVVRAYGTGDITRPLILSGKNGTGKTLLGDLIPTAIEGFKPQINRVKSCDLNSSNEIYSQFTRNKQFDNLYTSNNQRYNYNVIEEVNFDNKARDAFRVVLDEYRGIDLTIITTNELEKIDIGIRSRCEILHVPPCEPEVFLPYARAIIFAEGYDIDDSALADALDAVYELRPDNRRYYQKLDELLR
jgi:DNA polymerase III delta prime subunit